MNERVLVAEDEAVLRQNLCEFLTRAGYIVEGAPDGEVALKRALEDDFAVVVADIRMPNMDGVTLLRRLVAERPETFVLLTTAYASVESAVEALRLGAHDYLLKPIVIEDLLQKLHNLIAYRALRGEVQRLRRELHSTLGYEGMVGESPAMQRLFQAIERVAPTGSTALITGESGTGKELVARAIHARSNIKEREFVAVNMAAMPIDLVESQLFGHEKGSFTSADRRRDGILRAVHGGTVFLDELGDLPLSAQAKLLRAIEQREVMPVGADHAVKVEFRLVAATHRDLASLVGEGRFREDLFFRLNVFRIDLPPLRERSEDISPLVHHFLSLHARVLGRRSPSISNEALRCLVAYRWPGNVRELSNVVERAVILAADGRIEPEHLPPEFLATGPDPLDLRRAIERFEREHISRVLRVAGNSRERAAELLGVDVATLYRRLAKYRPGETGDKVASVRGPSAGEGHQIPPKQS